MLCILASFFDLSARVRKASTGADQRKPEQCLFLLNFSLLHFPLLYGTGNHIKNKKGLWKVSLSCRPHLLQPQAQNFMSHQAGSSAHQAHSPCRAVGQIMLSFGHWAPKRQDHSEAENELYAVVSVKQEYSKCIMSVQRSTWQEHRAKRRDWGRVCATTKENNPQRKIHYVNENGKLDILSNWKSSIIRIT